MSGFFITFEGIEGSGKSTQVKLLKEKFKDKKYDVFFTKEPGDTQIGKKIRDLLLNPKYDKICDKAEILLYAADRAQHVKEKIIPALKSEKIVVSDRYIDSNIAYQGHGRGLDMEMVRRVNEWVICNYWPDLTILFDLEVKKGLKRARDLTPDKTGDRLEREVINFHQRVRKAYLEMAKKEKRFRVIEAGRDPKLVFEDVYKVIKEELL